MVTVVEHLAVIILKTIFYVFSVVLKFQSLNFLHPTQSSFYFLHSYIWCKVLPSLNGLEDPKCVPG